jgi:hypothetical protein
MMYDEIRSGEIHKQSHYWLVNWSQIGYYGGRYRGDQARFFVETFQHLTYMTPFPVARYEFWTQQSCNDMQNIEVYLH